MPKSKQKQILIELFLGFSLVLVLFWCTKGVIWAVTTDPDDLTGEIDDLSQNLNSRRAEIDELKRQAELYRQKVIAERNEAFSLRSQINILDNQIARLKVEIKATEQEIELTELDIDDKNLQIKALEKKMVTQKTEISELLRLIYQNDEQSYLEILILNDSLSEFFNAAKFIEDLHNGLYDKVQELKITSANLEKEVQSLVATKELLAKQKTDLELEQEQLDEQQLVKQQILDDTQANEARFRDLYADIKAEQNSINSDIVSLERTLRDKLEEQDRLKTLKTLNSDKPFTWPVTSHTVTAYFHDPDYPYRYIMEHPAVDIRAGQGSAVSAVGPAYVAKVRADSKCSGSYAYVMLIHADGLATVYGHLSKIYVQEGEMVDRGQVIGLSGAMPGTCGSGRLTTGPHLHFEVRLNGIPVDPLKYLP